MKTKTGQLEGRLREKGKLLQWGGEGDLGVFLIKNVREWSTGKKIGAIRDSLDYRSTREEETLLVHLVLKGPSDRASFLLGAMRKGQEKGGNHRKERSQGTR